MELGDTVRATRIARRLEAGNSSNRERLNALPGSLLYKSFSFRGGLSLPSRVQYGSRSRVA